MFVDSNEKNPNIINILNEYGIQTEIKQLPVADYVWNNYAIERKSISDFIASVINNHLYDQLEDLILNYKSGAKVALIIHGDLNDVEWRYFKYFDDVSFYKSIGDIFTHYPDIGFFWVPDENIFATMLSSIYHQSFQRKKEHFPFVKKTKNHKVNVLISTKLFSVAQAKRILKEYSLRQIFDMELKDMIKIKGFGEVGVGKFIKFRGKK